MKLSTKVESAINRQINMEFGSAYAYLGMAAYFEQTAFTGFGKWMELQSKEELGHAHKFFKYLTERGGKVALQAISEPKCDYQSPIEAFQASLRQEQEVSASICGIYALALAEKDFATVSFLKWFLDEQVEEEKTATDIIVKLELVGDNLSGLYQIDQQAARRAEEQK
jgi:ferritin